MDKTWKWIGIAALGIAAAAVGTAVVLKIKRDRECCCTECIYDTDGFTGPVPAPLPPEKRGASEREEKFYPADKASGAEVADESEFPQE